MADRAVLVNSLVGKPYRADGEGPDHYGCWGLTRHFQLTAYGRDLPRIEVDPEVKLRQIVETFRLSREWANWQEVPHPTDGCLVTLSRRQNPAHIGTWVDLDRGGLLHAIEGPGVVFEPLSVIRTPVSGWQRVQFWVPR